ncbi:FHA domain-containing protein [Kosakonia sp. MUSA4]|uniref:FHA domain-containing protein n=1 Tax=Kosakonia sp. MUSA4 TaxID=2067958 RepID=UPI00159ACF81|nr:FHA domain-containing protein [Kosakonia sp. MUSA4]QJT82622.1 type III secretion protein HrpQ [Kosakonia sp. MUSA4]
MFELRVLNGLQEGAALPLSGESWSIGNAAERELQLSDNGIEPLHCQLALTAEGWKLTPCAGNVGNHQGEKSDVPLLLQPGDIFTLNGIWLSLDDAASPWKKAPPGSPIIAVAAQDNTPPATSAAPVSFASVLPRWAQIAAMTLLLLLTVTITSWILQPGMAQENANESLNVRPLLKDNAALRQVLVQKLRERELWPQVQLISSTNGITLSSELSPEQLPVVRRMVKAIRDEYQLGVALNDDTRLKNISLPFRIIQITSGLRANIVTEGGQRLFIGDERDGWRLTEITDDHVKFAGRENITVKW